MSIFICFAAEDRYNIAEPIVYHLKNYGIKVWYDRQALLLGDNRKEKNLEEGASKCRYAIVILSQHTTNAPCAMEEISILRKRFLNHELTLFPILYEIAPDELYPELQWVKDLIFKETNRHSGTREICNHIACKITGDELNECKYKKIQEIINSGEISIPRYIYALLRNYQMIDCENLNARVTMLYATYITIKCLHTSIKNNRVDVSSKIFERLFSETRLNLSIDYREIWLLENAICILINLYFL